MDNPALRERGSLSKAKTECHSAKKFMRKYISEGLWDVKKQAFDS
jgi:hypothetical protein